MSDQFALFTANRHGETLLGWEPVTPLHRADDQGGSIAAAARVIELGIAQAESRLVLEALTRHPGSTSAELAAKTPDLADEADQDQHQWRTTCARRLPGLEDRGLVRAVAPRPSIHRPDRGVDPDLAPCTVSPGQPKSLRWWPTR